jgi:hypothetical protein
VISSSPAPILIRDHDGDKRSESENCQIVVLSAAGRTHIPRIHRCGRVKRWVRRTVAGLLIGIALTIAGVYEPREIENQ